MLSRTLTEAGRTAGLLTPMRSQRAGRGIASTNAIVVMACEASAEVPACATSRLTERGTDDRLTLGP